MNTTKKGSSPAIRYRPIHGGPFGQSGQFVLATLPCIDRGLHAVKHMVLEPATGAVLAASTDKRQALDNARRLLRSAGHLAAVASANDAIYQQAALWPDEDLPAPAPGVKPKPVSRRRREVFDKGAGRCFYCGKVLTLDGTWHVDHSFPRALQGQDELPNLVPSCPSCNLAKSDKTALEFITKQQGDTQE